MAIKAQRLSPQTLLMKGFCKIISSTYCDIILRQYQNVLKLSDLKLSKEEFSKNFPQSKIGTFEEISSSISVKITSEFIILQDTTETAPVYHIIGN